MTKRKSVINNCPKCGQLMSPEKDHSCPPPMVGAVCHDKSGRPMLSRRGKRERSGGGVYA